MNADCCCTFLQTGDLHREKEEVQPGMGKGAQRHDVHLQHGPWAAAPPARPCVEGGGEHEPKVKRKLDIPLSPQHATGQPARLQVQGTL